MGKQGPPICRRTVVCCSPSIILSILVLVLSLEHTSRAELSCPEPQYSDKTYISRSTQFLRVAPKSKFLFPRDIFLAHSKDAMLICRSVGLQAATVNSMNEYWDVVQLVVDANRLRGPNGTISLKVAGLAKPGKIGLYINPRTTKPLVFQMFRLLEGNYIEAGRDCIKMECDLKDCYFAQAFCESKEKTIPFCQYPDDGECYKEGRPNEDSTELEDARPIRALGETDNRIYYGSKIQKAWSDAKSVCSNENLKLLSLTKNTTETSAFFKLLTNYTTERDSPFWDHTLWTSGKFEKQFGKNESFKFEGAEEEDKESRWLYSQNKGLWSWSSSNLVKKPKDELCMAIVQIEPPTIRPVACDLPNFFVCFRQKPKQGRQSGRFFNLYYSPPPPPPRRPPPPQSPPQVRYSPPPPPYYRPSSPPPPKNPPPSPTAKSPPPSPSYSWGASPPPPSPPYSWGAPPPSPPNSWGAPPPSPPNSWGAPPPSPPNSWGAGGSIWGSSSPTWSAPAAQSASNRADDQGEISDAFCSAVSSVCDCRKQTYCKFDAVMGSGCQSDVSLCKKLKFKKGECSRPDGFYSVRGAACENPNGGGDCRYLKTVIGVNLGGPAMIDSEDIEYQAGKEVEFEDDLSLARKKVPKRGPNVVGVSKEDSPLFSTYLLSSAENVKAPMATMCITYFVPAPEHGKFELNIKTVETQVLKRSFNIKFGGVRVFREVDLMSLSGKVGSAINFYIPYRVMKSKKVLAIKGYPDQQLLGGKIPLDFCLGECRDGKDSVDFIIGAFSVIKLDDDDGSEPTAGKGGKEEEEDDDDDSSEEQLETPSPSKKAKSKSSGDVVKTKPKSCKGSSLWECQSNPKCRYDLQAEECGDEGAFCKKLTFQKGECSHTKGWYTHGGAACKNPGGGGNCTPLKIILAVNMGGGELQDEHGIGYDAGNTVEMNDPHGLIFTGTKTEPTISGAPKGDEKLYATYEMAAAEKIKKPSADMCVTYSIPITQSGDYELALKTVEISSKKRSFNVKLNGVSVLKEVNLLALSGKVGAAINFFIAFKISADKKMLHLKGQPESPVTSKELPLAFCLGESKEKEVNNGFIMSGFTVVQFSAGDDDDDDEKGEDDEMESGEATRKPIINLTGLPSSRVPPKSKGGAGKVDAKVQVGAKGQAAKETQVWKPKGPFPSCKESGEDFCKCRKNPECRFYENGNGCMKATDFCKALKFQKYECARPNGWYAIGGAVCRNIAGSGDCTPVKTIMAVNLGGEDHEDEERIEYMGNGRVWFEDPHEIVPLIGIPKKKNEPIIKVTGVSKVDKVLYLSTQSASEDHITNFTTCIAYMIPVTESGLHELTLKTIEKKFAPRSFNVELNGIRLLKEIDILSMSGSVGAALNFYATYKISADKKTMSLRGYPDSNIESEQMALEFCFGECREPDIDINFIMSAFTVLQMSESEEEDAKSGEEGVKQEKKKDKSEEESKEEDGGDGDTTTTPSATKNKPQPEATTQKPANAPVTTPKKKVKVKSAKEFDVPDDRRR